MTPVDVAGEQRVGQMQTLLQAGKKCKVIDLLLQHGADPTVLIVLYMKQHFVTLENSNNGIESFFVATYLDLSIPSNQ